MEARGICVWDGTEVMGETQGLKPTSIWTLFPRPKGRGFLRRLALRGLMYDGNSGGARCGATARPIPGLKPTSIWDSVSTALKAVAFSVASLCEALCCPPLGTRAIYRERITGCRMIFGGA